MRAVRACALFAAVAVAQNGRQEYVTRCASCHGTDGNGGERGPAIVARLAARNDEQLSSLIRKRPH